MKISLCTIVRDEESSLPRCLASVKNAVDELCIIDTGSIDRTVEIARASGARVEEIPWPNDFSAARNASLDLATGDWILVLDADEELADPNGARAQLEEHARRWPGVPGRVWIENRDGSGERSRLAITRFFPAGAFRFEGRVHEQLVPVAEGTPARREDTEVLALHHGYDLQGEELDAKLERNTRLLREAIDADPDDGYLWYQLGRTRATASDHRGAVEALEQALARCPDNAPWAAGVFEVGGYSLRALGLSEQALGLLSQVEGAFQQRSDTCFLIALLAMDCGQLERAERGFRRCLELSEGGASEVESSLASRTYAPAFNLGVMKEVLGDKQEAATWFHRALELEPGHLPSLEALQRLGELAQGDWVQGPELPETDD